ncbi:MAG: glycosyltransferase family 4 protein [Bryobacteraceae bacterium]|jgi:glycosyltransferase involved in cell wall biosynthesis
MKVLILTNYYYPESVGTGVQYTQLAQDLKARGHEVTVVASYPSYPQGRIFEGYRNRLASCQTIDGVEIIRTLTWATPNKAFWPQLAKFGTFCLSAAPGYLRWRRRVDVVLSLLPPLPLGVSAWMIAKASGARLVVNVQDLYPDLAVALDYLTNSAAVAFFRAMERWIYRRSDSIVVISDGFRQNLLGKGVAPHKIRVVPNWADPEQIVPMPSDNAFRRETGASGELLVVYSGGLGYNAELETVLDAAVQLRGLAVRFAIVGDGVQKRALAEKAASAGLDNVKFFPFQPIERYGETLAAADVTLVTLNSAATFASVPSKIYKQMAAARPIVAITNPGNELDRLIQDAQCGVTAPPGDSQCLAAALRRALEERDAFAEMGRRGRAYLERNCSRRICVAQVEAVLAEVCAGPRAGSARKVA